MRRRWGDDDDDGDDDGDNKDKSIKTIVVTTRDTT